MEERNDTIWYLLILGALALFMMSGCICSKGRRVPSGRGDVGYNFEGKRVRMVMTPKGPMRPEQAAWVRTALARQEAASRISGEAEKRRSGRMMGASGRWRH